MDKKLLISIFISLLFILIYNGQVITGYVSANVNVIILKPIKFIFFDGNNNPITVNITFYYPDTNVEYDSSAINGNKTIKINRDLYDLQLFAYDNSISILFRHANLSNINQIDIGIDKLNLGIGELVSYAINKTFPMKNVTITIFYNNLNYNDESVLSVLACHEWDFLQKKCITQFVTISAIQNTEEKKFTFIVNNLSVFAIKEAAVGGVPEEIRGGGWISPIPIPKIPIPPIELPEIKPPYLPPINIFLKHPIIRISLSLLLVYISFFVVIYLLSIFFHRIYKLIFKEA
ncbi:MAG: hypothetical protein AB1571_02495 [Nanoarchaeota archaeon]